MNEEDKRFLKDKDDFLANFTNFGSWFKKNGQDIKVAMVNNSLLSIFFLISSYGVFSQKTNVRG